MKQGKSQRIRASFPQWVRLGVGTTLGLLVLLGSIIGVFLSFDAHHSVHASGVSEYATRPVPWGVALDGGGHIFIAEPGCLLPLCSAPLPQAYIGEYLVSDGSLVKEYPLPSGYTSPAFLTLDEGGHVWFTEPNSDAIGILDPTVTIAHPNGSWSQVPTSPGSAPLDLVLDSLGNLWFTEYSTGNIGFINTLVAPLLYVVVETGLPTLNSHPYGITASPDGTIWLTENATGKIAHFIPSLIGTHILGGITELSALVPHPHLIVADAQNNIWYSGESTGEIGEHPSTGADRTFSVETDLCPAPTGPTPPICPNTNVVGLAVASNGNIWFDDATSARVGSLDPTSGTVIAQTLTTANAHPGDGLAIDGAGNVIFTETQGNQWGKVPSGSFGPPVNKTWYFAEGHIGKGFKEFLTLGNPDPVNDCAVQIQYFSTVDGTTTLKSTTVTQLVLHSSRYTRPVNADLGIEPLQTPAADVSAVVTINQNSTPLCQGIVAERPMYFNYHGVTNESDVLGATHPQNNYYFADVQTVPGTSSFIDSYFTILTPGGESDAHVVVTYYATGNMVATQSRTIPSGSRGTISSGAISLPQHTIAVLTSDQPVVVERPSYFSHRNEANAGTVTSGATVIGAQNTKNDWLFAEGYTGGQFQENLALANFGTTPLLVQVKLEYTGGHTQTFSLSLGTLNQAIVDINQAMLHPMGICDTTPCQISPEVSVDVSANGPFVAERELFFHYQHTVNGHTLSATGGTDVVGLAGPNAYSAYSFAEGYVKTGYHEWLTLQNPTAQTEVLTLTLVNSYGRRYTTTVTINATTRGTIDLTQVVTQQLVQANDDYRGYEVAMTVSAANNAFFVAERPMYSNTAGSNFPTQGGTDVIGYIGN